MQDMNRTTGPIEDWAAKMREEAKHVDEMKTNDHYEIDAARRDLLNPVYVQAKADGMTYEEAEGNVKKASEATVKFVTKMHIMAWEEEIITTKELVRRINHVLEYTEELNEKELAELKKVYEGETE